MKADLEALQSNSSFTWRKEREKHTAPACHADPSCWTSSSARVELLFAPRNSKKACQATLGTLLRCDAWEHMEARGTNPSLDNLTGPKFCVRKLSLSFAELDGLKWLDSKYIPGKEDFLDVATTAIERSGRARVGLRVHTYTPDSTTS